MASMTGGQQMGRIPGNSPRMVLLESEQFLTELTRLFQKCRSSGSVFITLKKYDGRTKPIPRKSSVEGLEPAENKCLLRATDGKRKISTVVSSKEVNKFQMAYSNLLRANMDGLKKRDKKNKSKKSKPAQGGEQKLISEEDDSAGSPMPQFQTWEEFSRAAEKLYLADPMKVRVVLKYRHVDGNLCIKVTDDLVCLVYRTDQAQDVKKIEKFHSQLMRLMVAKESRNVTMETE
nr:Chain A, Signal Recognition Particle 9/14 Fusion Protein [Mus musculus]